jgi:hypothetical protein
MMYAVLADGSSTQGPKSAKYELPALRILPGAYMTALPASSGRESIVVQVCVATFSAYVGMMPSSEPATSTRPSGSWNMYG